MAYEYEPLSHPEAEIRVANLKPGAYNDEICVTFLIRRLETGKLPLSSDESFDYEALSYVWGSNESPSHVRVHRNGSDSDVISITRNLDVALRHLRSKDQTRLIWLDSISINQQDNHEKSIQVAIMGKVFSHAAHVIAWLGPEEDNSTEAFKMMQHWAQHIEVDWTMLTMQPSATSSDPTWADARICMPYEAGELESLRLLLERPYFERTWIRQEVGLATWASVKCGEQQIPWDAFRRAIHCVRSKGFQPASTNANLRPTFRQVLDVAYDLCFMSQHQYTYSVIRLWFRDAKCQDHRDRLYAVLSLLNEQDQQLGIEPDYSRKAEELYVDVARRALEKQQKLDLLENCELSSRVLNVPSWVPDWSSRLKFYIIPRPKWSACGWISAQATVTGADKLHVAGIRAAEIESVKAIEIDEHVWEYTDLLLILRELRPSDQALADNVESGHTLVDKCCRAFVGEEFSESYFPPRTDKPSFEESRKFLNTIWSSVASPDELMDSADEDSLAYLRSCQSVMIGRCFVVASGGFIGLAPAGTREGDVVCVLLGCKNPVVLRPSPGTGSDPTWQVVGVCCVPGLMRGEAIYGDMLPDHYRAVSQPARYDDLIDWDDYSLYDTETETIKTNPAEILTEMGIKVERYQREPHLLEVLPETLHAAGIDVQNFTLV